MPDKYVPDAANPLCSVMDMSPNNKTRCSPDDRAWLSTAFHAVVLLGGDGRIGHQLNGGELVGW
jgi:hypothetical protein